VRDLIRRIRRQINDHAGDIRPELSQANAAHRGGNSRDNRLLHGHARTREIQHQAIGILHPRRARIELALAFDPHAGARGGLRHRHAGDYRRSGRYSRRFVGLRQQWRFTARQARED